MIDFKSYVSTNKKKIFKYIAIAVAIVIGLMVFAQFVG